MIERACELFPGYVKVDNLSVFVLYEVCDSGGVSYNGVVVSVDRGLLVQRKSVRGIFGLYHVGVSRVDGICLFSGISYDELVCFSFAEM